MSALAWLGVALAVGAAAGVAWLLAVGRWYQRNAMGDAYFARPLAERRAFKAQVGRVARILGPPLRLLTTLYKPGIPSCEYRGVTGPGGNCTRGTFARTADYTPVAGDVFVATQMKCGTTWMQQVVYEVLSHGRGNLGDDGHRHLYAVSPWIEARMSVPLERAPRIGTGGARVIKTHMPTLLCPYGEDARYVYVTRHPVACFASCVDFVRMLAGPLAEPLPRMLDWFCSDRMWWRSWPEHVEGWWRWAQERPNVLFVHYEEMLDDLPGCVDRVAGFLDVSLTPGEREAVVHKSGFEYMKAHEELFEMTPPTLLTEPGGSFFVSGRHERKRDVGPAERERILAFCRERLRGGAYPAARFYPDLADPAAG